MKGEWIWCFVAVTLGTTVLFLSTFLQALEVWRLHTTPYVHTID